MSVAAITTTSTVMRTTRGELLPHLVALAKLLRGVRSVPIMAAYVVLDGTNSMLWATDFETTIGKVLDIQGDRVVVPLDDLLSAVKAGGGTGKAALALPVVVSITGTSGLVSVGQHLRVPLRAHPEPDNYPESGHLLTPGEPLAEVVSDKLREAWTSVAFATAPAKEMLPILESVRLLTSKLTGRLEFLATDRYRLAKTEVVTRVEQDIAVNIPNGLGRFLPLLSPGSQVTLSTRGDVTLNQMGDGLVISDHLTVIHQRLYDGDYPKVQSIIPDRWDIDFGVERDALLQAVATATPLVERNVPVKLLLTRDRGAVLQVKRDDDFVEVATVPGGWCKEDFEVGLNVQFLKEVVAAFPKGEHILIHANQPTRPLGFDSPQGHLQVILMPVRFKS